MLMHHTLDCAKSRLHRESHWLVNRSFLLTESFCKNYLFSVTSSWCIRVNPFIVCTSRIFWCTLACTAHTGWRALI